jgi:hypothetical protein
MIMQIPVLQLTRPVDLTDYHPDMLHPSTGKPVIVHVWVNPSRDFLRAYNDLMARWAQLRTPATEDAPAPEGELQAINDAMADWYAQLWSQHPDAASRWTREDVLALAGMGSDPALYRWLCAQAWARINAHRSQESKN